MFFLFFFPVRMFFTVFFSFFPVGCFASLQPFCFQGLTYNTQHTRVGGHEPAQPSRDSKTHSDARYVVTSLLLYVVPFHLAVHCLLRRGPLGQTHRLRRHRHPESRRWSHHPDGWLW